MIGKFKDLKSENVVLPIRGAFRHRRVHGWRKTMVFGLLITALGLGSACALLYYCAVFALPVFISLSVAFWALNAGAGVASAFVGFAAGVIVFLIGQLACSHSCSLAVRWGIALLFALPAAVAGYSLVLQISELGVPSIVWRHVLAIIGAMLIALTAMAQVRKSPTESPRG
jgi:hypothetical protein